jgi:hypothetical protein
MKLKHVVAFLTLLALGCQEPSGTSGRSDTSSKPSVNSTSQSEDLAGLGGTETGTTELKEVSFNVTGMK